MHHAVCLAALLLLTASAAEAQIYAWRDARGTLVVSDRPPAGTTAAVRTYPVANSRNTVLATRPASPSALGSYDDIITEQARRLGVRPDLVRAVIQVESGYNPRAVSVKGAMGLMQLMPSTAAHFGVRQPFDPAENIRGGVTYLRQLLDRYQDNETLALAAYNAGPEAVERHGLRVPPYRETRDYVSRIQNRTPTPTSPGTRPIYKTIEIINGRPVPRYSHAKPESGPYEVIRQTP